MRRATLTFTGTSERGETTKLCKAALAQEGPLDTHELAQRV